jgi:hypothetical protein
VRRKVTVWPLAVALVIAAGCEPNVPTATRAAVRPPSVAPNLVRYFERPGKVWTADDEMARVAREEIPGFGGYFVDSAGVTQVFLKDVRGRDHALAALRNVLSRQEWPAGRGPNLAQNRVVAARFDFDELQRWRLTLRERIFDTPGVVMLDIDETKNNISVGISKPSSRGAVMSVVASLGIPEGAVTTTATPITCSLSTATCPAPSDSSSTDPAPLPDFGSVPGRLDGEATTVMGGYQIYHDPNPATGQAYGCTLGVNAQVDFSNGTLDGFFTNSHCTNVLFATDGTSFFQAGRPLGYEGWDRGTFNGDTEWRCGYLTPCRYSDAAFARYSPGAPYWQLGYIAKASSQSTYGNAIKSVSGRYRITKYFSPPTAEPYFGQPMVKVGSTTGETGGRIVQTCLDITTTQQTPGMSQPLRYNLLCQYQVSNSWAAGGDSGSPVFFIDSGTDVAFYGLLWGQPVGVPTSYYFSGWYQIVWGDMHTYPAYVRIKYFG